MTLKIVCEAGCNFRNLDEAFMFIDKCRELEIPFCKFQLFNEDNIKDADPTIQDFLRSIMLSKDDAKDLFEYGKKIGQEVFFTLMYDCIDILEDMGINYYKIRFKDRYNSEIIDKVLATNKPMFISNSFCKVSFKPLNYYPLYCIPEYPAKHGYELEDIDFTYFYGISDHSPDLFLLRKILKLLRNSKDTTFLYFEKHLHLDTYPDCLEKEWSVSFSELEEVLKK